MPIMPPRRKVSTDNSGVNALISFLGLNDSDPAQASMDLVNPAVGMAKRSARSILPSLADLATGGAQDKATKFNIFGGTADEIENIRSTLTDALTRLNRYFDTDIDTSRINIRLIDPEDFTPKAGLASEKNLSAHLQTMGDGRAQIRINKNFLSDDKFRTLEEDIVHEITHFMDDNNLIPSEFKERLGALNTEDLADKVGRGNVPAVGMAKRAAKLD